MSFKTEDLGKNMYKITVEVAADLFEKACEKAYQKNKNKIQLQGFRKGKAPRALIEKVYGAGVFYEDAANDLIDEEYKKVLNDCELEIVSRPSIDVTQCEKGKDFIFTAEVAVKPEIAVTNYKGIEVDAVKAEVTDGEVDAELDKEREKNARKITVEEGPVQDGDEIKLDYAGTVDGVAFEGGTAEDAELKIGSHKFIDNFEEQLIGLNIGDEKDVNVTFPENYQAEELSGKAAVFKCKINAITRNELPEADDDFAKDVSEFDTIDEFKNDIRAKLLENKEKEIKAAKENAVIDKIIENTEMEIPEAMVEYQAQQMAEEFAQRLQYQGMSIEMYLKYTKQTINDLVEQSKPQALKRIQYRLVLEGIVKAENITVSDEELEKEFDNMATQYNMEKDKIKEMIVGKELDNMKMDLAVSKAIDIVRDAAVEK